MPTKPTKSSGARIRDAQRRRTGKLLIATAAEAMLEAVPALKLPVKFFRAAQSIRDELFARKVAAFLEVMAGVDESDRRRFIDELAADAGSRDKAGTALMLLLDRLDDVEKPTVVGRLYLAALQRRITFADLRRFCTIVDRAHFPDLLALAQLTPGDRIDPVSAPLLNALGLAVATRENYGTLADVDPGAETWYELNELGRRFLAAAFGDDQQ